MISLAEFFVLNRSIIYFVYGLVFFILGVAIILQTRQTSRLDLARSLRWLAAFGITHGFHEWGDLFIPIQAAYLSPEVLRILYILHLVLLALSFIFLIEFGLALLYTGKRGRWFHWLTAILFVGWLLALVTMIPPGISDERAWRYPANALARYFIGLPGGLLAAYGLRHHTMLRIKPLDVPRIVLTLQVAGIALGVYALLAGLVPPPVNFFPGNVINRVTFTDTVGIPPLVFRSLTGMIIAVALIRALEVFDVETARRIEELEQHQIVTAERERLARELHDGAIQKVYTAGLLVESASRLADSKSEIGTRLGKSVIVLNDAIADLRRNLSELHAGSQTSAESLPTLLQKIAEDSHYTSMVNITLDMDVPDRRRLSPIRSGHVFSIVNEAMANIVRHAQAKSVEIHAHDLGVQLQIDIKDDGIGIPPEPKAGYGLRNMRDRARLLNGDLRFANNKGTAVTLTIPWVDQ
ncbi:MAG TPA: ATP-binding protein [Anaerolineales bacterium]|nr:ATP-binding protein [Anaerolineales bacterium]